MILVHRRYLKKEMVTGASVIFKWVGYDPSEIVTSILFLVCYSSIMDFFCYLRYNIGIWTD